MTPGARRLMMQNNTKEINPQTGWSQSGNLVCQGPTVPANPGQPAAGNVVKMQVCFPECCVYTIQFDISQQYQALGNAGQLVFADINWTINGTSVRRSVSVMSGTTISGMGEAVDVRVYDGSPPGSEVGLPGQVYAVVINIAPGLRPAESQQPFYDIPYPENAGPFSTYLGTCAIPVAAASSYQLFFPQQDTFLSAGGLFPPNRPPTTGGKLKPIGATSIHVTVGSINTPPHPILNQEAQVIIDNLNRVYDPRDCPLWNPLPPGAYAATLVNNSATDPYVFSVTLGIDG